MQHCFAIARADVAAQEEGGEGDDDGEETSTQRSRRKKRELAAFESRGAKLKAVPDEPPPDDEEGEEGAGGGAPSGPPADAPCWPEVARALEGSPKELLLERQAGQEGHAWQVDPALFRCTSLNLLKLSLKGADAAAPKPLRAVPDDLRFLTGQPPRRALARYCRHSLSCRGLPQQGCAPSSCPTTR